MILKLIRTSVMNPLVLFSAFVIGTGVRSYLYGPTANSPSGPGLIADERSSDGSQEIYQQDVPATRVSYGSNVPEREASILSYTRHIQGNNNADKTSFSTSNGISSSHNVYLVPGKQVSVDENGNPVEIRGNIAMEGHSYHQSPEGMQVSLTWSADQKGGSLGGSHQSISFSQPEAASNLAARDGGSNYNRASVKQERNEAYQNHKSIHQQQYSH